LLSRYIGGSSVGSLELRLIEMARNSVDITPDWAGRLIDVVDLDADGHYEAVVDDSPWNLKIHHQSIRYSPFVPVILARRDGRFVRACRDYPGAYDSFIRENLRRARGSGDHAPTALSTAFFAYLQIGAFAEARALLDQFERAMGFFLGAFAWTGNLEAFPTPEQIREDHQDVLEAIARNPDVACPSSVPGLPAGRHRYLRPYDESERNRVRRR